jgi:hypothetical protein
LTPTVIRGRAYVRSSTEPESISWAPCLRANVSLIDELGVEGFDQPSSLEDEMAIVAKVLAQAP